MRFDLSSCLTENGLTLVQGDIVEFSGYFSISPDGPFPPQFRKVPNLRAFAFAIVDGQEYACDNFGDNFTIAKNNTVFDAPSSSDFPEGCDVALLNYRLVTVNNGFSDFFGSEYRQAVRIDSITFEFDPTILEAFNTSDVEVIIPGHPYHGNNSFSLPPLSDYPDGNYSLRFDTLVNVPALNIVQSNSFNLRIILTPNCKSEFGSSLGNNVYRMHPTMYFTDRYYAQFIGDGSCAEEKVESEENLVTYTEPPVLTFSPFGTANYLLLGDTAEWTLQHCNTSFESSAGLTWIAVEDTTSSIVIVSMEDISDPLNPVSLELNSYGPDERYVFAYAPGLVEVDNNNSLDDICNIIRIKAIAKRCGTIPFVTYSGWNCSAFREENWDPEQYPPCEDSQVALSLTTLEPFLDANVIQQPEGNPEICDTSTVAILVKNTGIGTAFDLKTQIILPGEGMELVPGSVEIAYPESAEFQSVLADPELMVENGVNIYEYQDFSLLNEFLDQNGLRGFIPGNPNNENQFILRYKFVTDCDFKNGSILKYSFQGVKGCGELSNYEAGESLPIIISGTEPDIGKLYDVSFSPQSAMAPGTSAQIEIGVTNLSSTVSEENEWISLNIPANISYVEGSSVALAPESWEPGEPQILSANGETQLQWMLPVGLIQSDIANITFQLLAPELECDVTDIDVLLQTIAVKELYCANLDINCDIVTVTSTLGDEMTFLPVLQNQLAIDFPSVISQCQEGSTEQIQIEAILSSPDFDFLAIPFEVKYFYDADGNGSVSAGDTEVGAFSESGPFSELNPLSLSHTLSVPVEQACGLILQIDTIGLPFLCQVLETPISIPQLQNAGADQVLCASSETTFELIMGEADCVVEGIYDYTWAAVPPALTGDLSNTKVPSPLLTISYDGVGQDTLIYILETERPECSISHDTVRVIRSPAVVIQQSPLLSVEEGESIVLQPVILSGTAPFIYQWAPEETLDDPASSSPLATPLEYTRYTVTITDASGCSESSIFDVYIGDIIDAQVIPSDTTICQGETVEIHASGGAEYLWLEGDSNPSEGNLSDYQIANPLFSNGLAGSTYEYTVLVTDEAFPGITDSAFVIIHVNELPIVDAGEDLIMCLGDTISILANASENNVSLSWSPDVLEGENTINPRIAPTETTEYILTAIDANGCVQSDTMVVEVLDCGCVPPVVNHIITNAASCGQEDGYASIGMAGNPFDYIFDWQPNIGYSEGAGNIRTSLPYGGYTVTITQDNDPQCFTTIYLTIENADGPQATTLLSAATCEAANGEALISPVNYSYTWSDGVVGFERTDLYAGTYFVTVTDLENAACPNVLRVEMPLDNPLAAEIVVNTHPVCMEGNGSVTINVTGGSGDYSFSWESGTNTQDNLEAGIYTVSITDNDTTACSIPFIFVLTDEVPQATVNILDVHHESCSGSEDGFVDFDLELDGNIALPLDTVISNDLLEFANGQLPPGDYCILITDANGCVAGGECFTVEAPDPLRIGIVSTPACDNEGTISLSLSGGVPPYTIDWQDLIGQDNAMERQGLIAASYSVTILDANGCVVTTEVEVEACPCIYPSIISTTIQPATCGNSDGAATIQLGNDETAFEFFWEPDIGVSNIEGNSRTGLPFGAYTVTIVNADNELCSTEISFIITNSDGPQATGFTTPATCKAADGTASLQPEEFEYAWSDGGLGAIRQDLTAGTYYVTFFDPADPDCPNIMEIIVPQDNPLVAEMLVNVHPICGQSNGSVTVNVFGGSGDYSFSWPSATNTQDDLAAGIYTVTITDNSETGCSLPFIFVLTDDVPEAAVTITDTLHVSCYGAQDGGVLFDINFDPAFTEPADTIISNGIQQYENGELPPGGYCVMIVDGNGCVAGGACFTIESPDPIQFAFEVEPFCEEGGSVNVSISGGTAPFSYDWEDLEGDDNEQNRDSLPIGEFYLTVTDINECELSSGAIAIDSCAFCDLFTDVDSFYLQAPDCLSEATFCVPIPSDFIHRFVIEDNGAVYTKELGRCDYDTQGVYTYATLYGLGNAGPYEVISWPVNDEIFTGTFVAIQDLVDSMNVWDPMGNWSLSNDGPFILGGYNANNYDQIDVEVISLGITSFLGFNQGLYPNGYSVDLAVGSHELIITDTLTGCVENVWVEVICTNSDTLHLILDIGESDTLCLSGDELVGAVDTIYSGCEEGDNTTFEILNDSCVVFTGVSEGIDSVCLIACDSLGICDTTFLIIDVMDLIDNDIYDTITVSQTLEYCIDTSMVNLPGTIISIENICEDESGSFVYFEVDEETYCVQYSGLFIGTETACIEICDDAGNCDVINFHITVVPGGIVVDTIFINAPPETDCIDLSLLEGEAVEITDDCEDSNGENVIFTIDEENYCITYDGISVGADTACIRVADAFGNISLTIYYITAVETTTEYILDTIYINETVIHCLDTTELPGTEPYFVDNFCWDESGDFVDFFTLPDSICLEYTGLEIGVDSACYIICDNLGICDTTFFTVWVVEYLELPIANNDTAYTIKETPVVVNIHGNDVIFGVDTTYISSGPSYGEASLNQDGSITYTPIGDFCDREDQLTYVICNSIGCDSAVVTIFIVCVDVEIFTAVSPNRDGVNDYFHIGGIEDKPENKLRIFNRWGNLVFETRAYQNDWDGTWNGKDLPDGTYYYMFEVNDNGEVFHFRGYLEIFR
ncbi:MAG: T9SS type B sorting domain-containing protein [Bacteroidetes bacterium]|nr:T9SS type B sorting domain-containing protein [Bacteroidota bacterium]